MVLGTVHYVHTLALRDTPTLSKVIKNRICGWKNGSVVRDLFLLCRTHLADVVQPSSNFDSCSSNSGVLVSF